VQLESQLPHRYEKPGKPGFSFARFVELRHRMTCMLDAERRHLKIFWKAAAWLPP